MLDKRKVQKSELKLGKMLDKRKVQKSELKKVLKLVKMLGMQM
jgi:hypothetical protein